MVDCSTYSRCQFCDGKPDGLGEAYKHFRDHWRSDDFVYQCDDCGIAFLAPADLKRHEAEKKVDQKVTCPESECGGFFNSKKCLQFHTYYSHGMCRMCVKVCKSGEQLSEHMKKHQKHVRPCAGCKTKKQHQSLFIDFRRTGRDNKRYCKDCYPLQIGCTFDDLWPTCKICNWTMYENDFGNAKLTHYQRFHPWYFSGSDNVRSNADIFKKSNELCKRDELEDGSDSDSNDSLRLKVRLPFTNIKTHKQEVETNDPTLKTEPGTSTSSGADKIENADVIESRIMKSKEHKKLPVKSEPHFVASGESNVDNIGSIRSVWEGIDSSGHHTMDNANNAEESESQNKTLEADSNELHMTFGDLAEKTEQNSPDIDRILEVLQKDERLLDKVECVLNKSEPLEKRPDEMVDLTLESPVKSQVPKLWERANSMTESVVSEVTDQTDDEESPSSSQNEVQSGFIGDELINMATETLKDTSELLDCLNSQQPVEVTSPTRSPSSPRRWNLQNNRKLKRTLRRQFERENSQLSPSLSASPANQQPKTMSQLFREFQKQHSTEKSPVQQPVTSPILLSNNLYSRIVTGASMIGNDTRKRLKVILPKSVQNTNQAAHLSTSPTSSPYKPILPRPVFGATRLMYPIVSTNPSIGQQRIVQVSGPSNTMSTAPLTSIQALQKVANSTVINPSSSSQSGGVCVDLKEKPQTYTVNCNIQKTVREGGKELKIKFDISPKTDKNETNRKHYTVNYSTDGNSGGCSMDSDKRTESRSDDDDDLIFEGVSREDCTEDDSLEIPKTVTGYRSPGVPTKSGLPMIVETYSNTSITTGPAGVPNLRKRPSEDCSDSSIRSKSARLVTMPGNDAGLVGLSSRKILNSNAVDPSLRKKKTWIIPYNEASEESNFGSFSFVLCNEDISKMSGKKIELLHHLNIFKQFLWSERERNLRPFYKSSTQFYETLNLPNDVEKHVDFFDTDAKKCFCCNEGFSSEEKFVNHILLECHRLDETIEVDRWMISEIA